MYQCQLPSVSTTKCDHKCHDLGLWEGVTAVEQKENIELTALVGVEGKVSVHVSTLRCAASTGKEWAFPTCEKYSPLTGREMWLL